MKRPYRLLGTLALFAAIASLTAPAQISTGGGGGGSLSLNLVPGQATTITVNFPGTPGGKPAFLLLSFNGTPSTVPTSFGPVALPLTFDGLTNFQIANGFNFTAGANVLQTFSLTNASGTAQFSVTVQPGLPPGTVIHAAPIVVSGGSITVSPIPVALGVAMPCTIGGGCGGGGTYQGPGDTVPPNPGAGNNICGQLPANCTLTAANDPIGCTVLHAEITVPTTYQGPISFGCAQGVGEVGELTYGQLTALLAAAQGIGANYIDLNWGSNVPLKHLYNYPVKALQQGCVQWLAMGPAAYACGAIQICNEIVGSPAALGAFGTQHGFFFGPCDPTDWNRAYGQNTACVTDLNCFGGPALTGIRLRLRVDCMLTLLALINGANPGFFTNSTVVWVFAGEWCPDDF